ncbi:MAG: CRISPR-associated helicase Cas3' [Planctomycetes bacterium]|nr:CRISPR-associated helicase Cas3' [Planctomycetota bacterium]
MSLADHCLDTETAAVAIFSGRALESWCRFFRLTNPAAFVRDLRVACLFHDLGKANADFQAAITQQTHDQAIRHEHLSGLVLCLDSVQQWIRASGCDYDAVVAAVLSHHAKASGYSRDDFYWARPDGRPPIRTLLTHDECRVILQRVGSVLGSAPPGPLPSDPWPSGVWTDAWNAGLDAATEVDPPPDDEFCSRRNHLLAVKAATVAADAVASGLWREQRDLVGFLAGSLHRPALTGARIRADIIERRVQHLRAAGKWQDWSDFQKAADTVELRSAIVAGCGSGKTLFAWRWAAAAADKESIGSVIFLYPTRATATEGFRDYVAWAPETDASLLTGTATLDLEGMASNPVESTRNKKYEDEADARLFALASWKRTYFSATLDQFLSFLEHGYSGLCLLPQLADSALVIDEVHSLDRHLFARLVALLTHFRGPILLMSATLPRERLEVLTSLGVRIFPDAGERPRFADLVSEEDRPRYTLARCRDRDSALAAALASDAAGPRSTLWVVNTVKRCQALVSQLRAKGLDPLVYHSRFTARDRRARHRDVVAAFQAAVGKRWAVTTQVCEMSLDLDADRLVSEDAPLTALIQRLGRANRSRSRHRDFRAEVLTYVPEDANPYAHEDGGREALVATGLFCADHDGCELGQAHLAHAMSSDKYAPRLCMPQASAGFLSGGWFATARPLRGEDDDRDVRCVLSTDLNAGLGVRGMPGDSEPLDAWIINVPRRFVLSLKQKGQEVAADRPPWMARARLHIADGSRYDPNLGFLLIDQV